MNKHSTFNFQHSTPKSDGELDRSFDVGRSMLNVECSPPASHWLLLNSGPCPAAFNMALDEALLESVSQLGRPVLRIYGWTEPAATFGYFQKFAEIERATSLRPLIRRPTGGGLVPHDADWTYSLAFPVSHEWHALSATESYRRVHEWIQSAFAELNIATELAPCCQKTVSGQCFVGHEKFDLLWHGQKIAGAAQRRNKSGLLIQGSVQPPPNPPPPADWVRALSTAGIKYFKGSSQPCVMDSSLKLRAEELMREKYSQAGHNEKR